MRVEFVQVGDRVPGREFIEGLQEPFRSRIETTIKRLQSGEKITNHMHVKHLRDGVWEIKSFQARLFFTWKPGAIVIGPGVIKKCDYHRPQDIDRAAKIFRRIA